MIDAILVATTTGSTAEAERIAGALVEKKLAACVQIEGPLISIYRWDGEVQRAEEWRAVIKTRREHYPAIESVIREFHSYDEPEIIAEPIIDGSSGYLKWLNECTT